MVIRTVSITNSGDLAMAQAQKAAMDSAKRSLAEATADAVKANVGYRAVSALPHLDNGRSGGHARARRRLGDRQRASGWKDMKHGGGIMKLVLAALLLDVPVDDPAWSADQLDSRPSHANPRDGWI